VPDLLNTGRKPSPAALEVPYDVQLRSFTDPAAVRRNIYDRVLDQFHGLKPVENARYRLELSEPHYADPEDFSLAEQKRAILEGGTLARRLRGTWGLIDQSTGKPVEKKLTTLARVPYYTPRGTFVLNGSEWTIANQMRLRSGVFTRVKDNGEAEAHVNVLPGHGFSHRYHLDPETGVFRMNIGQANLPLLPVLRAAGITDKQLREVWGQDLLQQNLKHDDPKIVDKLYEKLVSKPDPNATREEKRQAVAERLGKMRLDPDVTARTLGRPHATLSPEAMLAATRRLLAVSRGEENEDDRDDLAYQHFHGPEDLLSEPIGRDRLLLGQLLYKATRNGNLKHVQPGLFTRHLEGAIQGSGLGMPSEEVNALDILDAQTKVTRMGRGGIASVDSVPSSARGVHPSQLGFIDLVRTGESLLAGVDLRMANQTLKGSDNKIYSPYLDPKTGKTVYRTPQDVNKLVVAFPGQMQTSSPVVYAMKGGKLDMVPRKDIDLVLPHMEQAFSPLSNLIALKSMTKGQRVSMGSRILTQALPLRDAEAPLVQVRMPGTDRSYEEHYGRHAGTVWSQQGGRVVEVTPDWIKMKQDDGQVKTFELYNHSPYNRKTFIHNTPLVQAGDRVAPGQLLAHTNFTDKTGTLAMGKNLRVGFFPMKGLNHEDAYAISASAAAKLSSEHAYQHYHEYDENTKRFKRDFVSIFPAAYPRAVLDNFDEHGIIKPGTIVRSGDPLVLLARERELSHRQVHSAHKGSWSNQSLTWDHHADGIVTDANRTDKGVNVVVKSYSPMYEGDKLCYDPKTEVLTRNGWKPVAEVTLEDHVASLADDGWLEYVQPVAVTSYQHCGKMYRLATPQVDLLVTPDHNLYAMKRYASGYSRSSYQLQPASALFGKRYRLKRDCRSEGTSPEFVELSGVVVKAGQFGRGKRTIPPLRLPVSTYMMLLGMYLSEGCSFSHPKSGSYGIDIAQIKPASIKLLHDALTAAGLKFSWTPHGAKIYSKVLANYFKQFGDCYEKYIPNEVFDWNCEDLLTLWEWLMWGDGCFGKTSSGYTTTSKRLADDVQRLALRLNMSANIAVGEPYDCVIKGKLYHCRPRYQLSFYFKNAPEINHSHVRKQNGQLEEWVDYDGPVYCVSLPCNHVLYVRRNGKPVWCGNSGAHGNKGIVTIVPDDEMPTDESGQPVEVATNDLSVITRVNPSQITLALLGKIAARTGVPYKLEDFDPNNSDYSAWALREAAKHGVKTTETLTDPKTGRQIPNVFVGNMHFYKLHHQAEGKGSSRGLGAYTSDQTPARGSGENRQAKKIATMDVGALLSHGALSVIRDNKLFRGNQNLEFWTSYMAGDRPASPPVPFVYEKFVNQLKGSGVNVVRDGPRTHILALTQRDVNKLAGNRELRNAELVDWRGGMKPIPGGLFDPGLTGSHGGGHWSAIRLHEPLPNPVFEEPVRRVLGMTQKSFEDVLSGKEKLNGVAGPAGIYRALDRINLDQAIEQCRADIASGRRTKRDEAVRKLAFLKSAQENKLHPRDWILSSVPVLPPIFRPVSVMQGSGGQLIADANLLYKDLFEANNVLKELSGVSADVSKERLNLYNAFKAVVGLGDPVNPKNRERQVQGLLSQIFSTSPKYNMAQQKLIGTPVNLVGRGVISPDPDLTMDEVGVPEEQAWTVYSPFVIRNLVRKGVGRARALEFLKDRHSVARKALLEEMEVAPVTFTRAPVWHRFGHIALWPKLVKGDMIRIPPFILKGIGGDHDGDATNWHVMVSDEARREAALKMLPSRNLFAVSDFQSPVYGLANEYVGGAYRMTQPPDKNKRPRVFATMADLRRAWEHGELDPDSPVEVIKHEEK
jgi:DNA-directed RNA polymerase beta subunit